MASFNEPTTTSTYSSIWATVRSLIASCIKLDPTSDTNLPTNAKRHCSSSNNKLQKWNGSAWVDDDVHFGNPVGIGTTSPTYTLDVRSATGYVGASQYAADALGPELILRKSRNATVGNNTIVQNNDVLGIIRFQGADGSSYQTAAVIKAFVNGTPGGTNDMPGALTFETAADGASSTTERMRIAQDGRVGIGETSLSHQFTVKNTSSGQVVAYFNHAATSGGLSVPAVGIVKYDNTNTTSQVFQRFEINAGATGSGQINANGAGQAAFGSYSDARLKENIADLPGQLAAILSLRPVEFDYLDGSGHQIGFIAQEVREVYPDLVGERDDGMLTLSGLDKNDARLIKAFQEMADKVATLEAKVAALEAR